MPGDHGHRRPARAAQAARGRRPPRHRRQRAGHVLPARRRRSARRGTSSSLERVGEALGARDLDRERRACCSAPASTSSARRCAAATSSTSPRTRSSRACSAPRSCAASSRRAWAPRSSTSPPTTRRPTACGLGRRRPAPAARDLPARLPARRRGRAAVDRHVLVQPHQRRLRVGGPVAAHRRCCATSGASRASSSPTGARSTTASPALAAGLDLEMPCDDGVTDAADRRRRAATARSTRRVRGRRAPAACSTSCARRATVRAPIEGRLDVDAHHALAREAAGRSIVLLKNDGGAAAARRRTASRRRHRRASPRSRATRAPARRMINPTRLDDALDGSARRGGATSPFARRLQRSTVDLGRPRRGAARRGRRRGIRRGRRRGVPRPAGASGVRGLRPRAHRPAGRAARAARRRARGQPAHRRRALERRRRARCRASPTACPRSSRAGCSARPAAARSPTCCSARSTRRASSPRRSRCASRTPRRTSTSRASSRTSATARACSSATAGTTRALEVALPVRPRPVVHDVRVRGCRGHRSDADGDVDGARRRSRTPATARAARSCRSTRRCPGSAVQRAGARAQGVRVGRARAGRVARGRAAPCAARTSRTGTSALDRWVVEGGDVRRRRRRRRAATSARPSRSTVEGDAVVLPLSRTSSIGEVMAHPVARDRWCRRSRR